MPDPKRRVLLAVPTAYGNNHPQSYNSMYRAIGTSQRCEVRLHVTQGDALLSRVRNLHVTEFLERPDCGWLACLDSDIEVSNASQSDNWLDRLTDWNLPLVGGLYRVKSDEDARCSSVVLDPGLGPPAPDTGLREMRWLSTGVWMVRRDCAEMMARSYPELWYDADSGVKRKIFGGFICFIADVMRGNGSGFRKYLSEDWAFCERWRHIGGRIFADTSIRTVHYGCKGFPMWPPKK